MKRRLGVQSTCIGSKGISEVEALSYIKNAGFDCFFTGSYKLDAVSALKNEADKQGLDFEFIHAKWHYTDAMGGRFFMNEFWKPGLSYLPLFDATIEAMDSAAACGISGICQHITSGWVAPPACDIGFERFDRLVDHAVKKGVKLTFENLRNYGRDKEDPAKDADYHLLPYDGTFDYGAMIEKMDKYGYEGALTLEVGQRKEYQHMSPEDFLAMLYERTVRLSKGEK